MGRCLASRVPRSLHQGHFRVGGTKAGNMFSKPSRVQGAKRYLKPDMLNPRIKPHRDTRSGSQSRPDSKSVPEEQAPGTKRKPGKFCLLDSRTALARPEGPWSTQVLIPQPEAVLNFACETLSSFSFCKADAAGSLPRRPRDRGSQRQLRGPE